jgi:hypothetical protein
VRSRPGWQRLHPGCTATVPRVRQQNDRLFRKHRTNYTGEMGTRSAWTPERRARQADAIRRWQPWRASTGPKSALGKAIASRNGVGNRNPYIDHVAWNYVAALKREWRLESAITGCMLKRNGQYYRRGSPQRNRPLSDGGYKANERRLAGHVKRLHVLQSFRPILPVIDECSVTLTTDW